MRCFSCFSKCFGRSDSLSTPKGDASTDTVVEDTTVSVTVASSPTNGKGKGKVTDTYTLGKVIGSGSYSVVRESVHKKSKQKFAIKCIKRSELSEEDDEAIQFEVSILQQMKHRHIMTLEEFFVEPEYYYLVTEFVGGGELFDRIVEKTFYTEKEARDLVKILIDAIKYCHDQNVVHRDLKPENLLLMSADDDASIKLADFGFAKTVTKDDSGLVTTCGTPGYVAPEILEGASYGKPVDIWSIGVITYILLCGYPPFHDDSQPLLFKKIRKGKYYYDSPYWDNVSTDAKEFISKMLVVNPKDRASAGELLEHKWITGTDVATVPLTSALTELRRFHARKKFKAAVHSVQATISMNKALSGLGESARNSNSAVSL
ncbi:Calcium/calmodulin dependent protein Kinase [Phytophthora palmivora]|uniref:Calcium/calmodulin dependent protein Kinase n=1 Tax=Phytophthora palmivora TaxID=4796 RepID=A0A2P4Y2P1_9STRA|nr:Calcium/calmodulin dependent protein Kinase [Phytophthora palmivora]